VRIYEEFFCNDDDVGYHGESEAGRLLDVALCVC
jgi:hypothetical protein